MKKLNDVKPSLRKFLYCLKPLKQKIGPILVQLPEMVHWENPNVEVFLKQINRFWSWEFAIEARHKSWMKDEVRDTLSKKGIIWFIADWEGDYPSMEAVTASSAYLRFHGPNRKYATKYDNKFLSKYAKKAERWLGRIRIGKCPYV